MGTLHRYAELGDVGGLRQLLNERRVNINERSNNDKTALHIAAEKGYADIARLLLDRKADVTIQDEDGNTPLHIAAERRRPEIARLLIWCEYVRFSPDIPFYVARDETNFHIRNIEGNTPLDIARERRHHEIVRLLIQWHE